MIQRIQSVWLLLAAVCAFLTLDFSYYSGTNVPGMPYQKLTGANGGFLILSTTVLIGVLALTTVFLFNNRRLQLRLCVLGIVLEALLIFLYYRAVSNFTQGTYSLTALFHSGIVLFFVLAARGINKDEKLIKDSDRLR
jgi:peptidoglycan/LPS O-acetylase OafA/YrhL